MASDDKDRDENEDLHNRIAVLEAKLAHWQKFARTLCDLLRRVGSDRMSPEDARVRLQAAVENRLVVAPVATGAKDDERNRLARIADAQNAVRARDLPRAIEIYEGLVRDYPDEARLRLKLGDCYARTGDAENAATAYLAVATKHAEQGFFLKAVAVLKQVLKLLPLESEHIANCHRVLSNLYEELGLLHDAESSLCAFLAAVPLEDARIPSARERLRVIQEQLASHDEERA